MSGVDEFAFKVYITYYFHCSILPCDKMKQRDFWLSVATKLRFATPKCHMFSVLSLVLVDGNITRASERKYSVFSLLSSFL